MIHSMHGKRGLREPTLAAMQIPFAREQSFAESHFRTLKRWTFGKSMRLGNDHIANEIGMIQENIIGSPDAKLHDIPPPIRQVGQKSQRIAPERKQNLSRKFCLGPGRAGAARNL
jgi:hypothetical protein